MTEKEDAVYLANKIMDRQDGDPDDDLGILARQLLQSEERLQKVIAIAEGNSFDFDFVGTTFRLVYIIKVARGEAT